MSTPSIVADMTNEDYHAHDALGSTDLKNALRSYNHMVDSRRTFTTSKPLRIGTAVHTGVLEPELFDEQVHLISSVRSKTGKQEISDLKEKHGAHVLYFEEHDYSDIRRMVDAVRSHPTARELLEHHQGIRETSHFFTMEDEFDGKCRPDLMTPDVLMDLKTTFDASPYEFPRSVARYMYHLQAAWYMDGVQASGMTPKYHLIVAVEKSSPFEVAVYELDDRALDAGRDAYRAALQNIKVGLFDASRRGYGHGVRPVSLPPWALNRY